MKFLIQIPQLIYAGAEKVLVHFANDLVSRGHDVEILESYDRGLLKSKFDERVTFHCICSKEYSKKYYASFEDIKKEKNLLQKLEKCGKLAFSKIVGYRKFAEKLTAKYYKEKQFDVAINYLETESPQFLLNKICARKYIQWCHIDVANLDNPKIMDEKIPYMEKMDSIVCVAESVKNSFIERYPQLKDKTYVIYNFFDVNDIMKKAQEPFAYRAAKSGVPVLLSVGRMTPQKQYLRFLNVLYRLKTEGIVFQWYILGDGQEKEKIEEKIKDFHLEKFVFLEGISDNPYKYMKNCDLFVLPSGWEGFPTVTVEAKVLGCPVLATDVSGISEQLVNGKTGWIVDNDENSLYEGLKYLLEHPEIRCKLCLNHMKQILDSEEKYQRFIRLC